jgi:murein DD-endopeptidase MepM/ murein hydrolase activator NlpD
VIQTLRHLFFAIALSALIAIVEPLVQATLYQLRLVGMPAPVHLMTPVQQVRKSALHNTWHAKRDGGRRRHEGIDIFASRGTPVHATTEGIVVRIGNNNMGGKVVWTLGPGGQRHYYAHLDRHAGVHVGQRIQAGTLLGYVGNTGNARHTPAHLHYGIYTLAGTINPFPLLAADAP